MNYFYFHILNHKGFYSFCWYESEAMSYQCYWVSRQHLSLDMGE